jgi:hypothetical protein
MESGLPRHASMPVAYDEGQVLTRAVRNRARFRGQVLPDKQPLSIIGEGFAYPELTLNGKQAPHRRKPSHPIVH